MEGNAAAIASSGLHGAPSHAEHTSCRHGGKGFVFPLTEAEHDWPSGVQVLLYLIGLLYLFIGISVVSDVFMGAIEVICSSKRRLRQKSTGRLITVAVWNGTIANLSLMALGSSAPQILLSIIETTSGGFYSGDLGPGVIVGSAACRLFLVTAVAIAAVPSPNVRMLTQLNVFVVTAIFSVAAYFWIFLTCAIISPDVIEIWEAIVTLLMMPLMLVLSYLVDIGYFSKKQQPLERRHRQRPLRLAEDRSMPPPEHCKRFGVLGFPASVWELAAGLEPRDVFAPVLRMEGLEGMVSCKYHTEARSAIAGYDFLPSCGILEFAPGQDRALVPLRLLPKKLGEHSDSFQIVLNDAEGGACFDPYGDGGVQKSILNVTIRNENDDLILTSAGLRCCLVVDGIFNIDAVTFALCAWRENIRSAVMDVREEEEEDDDEYGRDIHEPPSAKDYLMHALTVPWKLACAIVCPPAPVANGYPCFIMSLLAIGGLMCLAIDLAQLFGCAANFQNEITAIAILAAGTTMPDMFASWAAAVKEHTADAAVLSVTSSNAVQVFMGIGIPWVISAIYWQCVGATAEWKSRYGEYLKDYPNGAFIVKSEDLAFGVVVFSIGALATLGCIAMRRMKCGGELGGPYLMKVMSVSLMVLMHVFYVAVSIWKVRAGDVGLGQQAYAIFIGLVVIENVLLLIGAFTYVVAGGEQTTPGKDYDAVMQDGTLPDRTPAMLPLPPPPPRLVGQPWTQPQGTYTGAYSEPGARIYGAPWCGAGGRSPWLSFTGAAMVCLAVERFRRRSPFDGRSYGDHEQSWLHPQPVGLGHDRFHVPPLLSPRSRDNSFESTLDESTIDSQSESEHGGPSPVAPLRSAASRVVDYVGRNAVDWAALGAAGFAAAQIVDTQSGGGGVFGAI